MPKAQCYYEILGISETATGDEVKRAYRNLALIWHPDKNQANPEEAHAKFQTILKAYETLSDSREREWYDKHKDQILNPDEKGEGAEEDLSKNLFQYFSSSCYANFDDSEDGFYTVYRKLFEELAEEELKAHELAARHAKGGSKQTKSRKDETPEFPTFGDSKSDYDDVVRPFYAYWSGFCTILTFDQLDKYNTLEAENRRILRLMEKENKKLKEQARKERNLSVRNLVEFVKKRDRRLKAHKLLVEQQNELNRQKTAEKQRQQREKRLNTATEYKPTAWEEMNDIEEQLRQLESEYDNPKRGKRNKAKIYESDEDDGDDDDDVDERGIDEEFDDESVGVPLSSNLDCDNDHLHQDEVVDEEEEEDEEEDDEPDLFCPACKKDFKSIGAYENHENSKKHKQNVVKLTKLLQEEERRLNK